MGPRLAMLMILVVICNVNMARLPSVYTRRALRMRRMQRDEENQT